MRFESIESVSVMRHLYIARAAQFAFPTYTYHNWAIFCAESGRFEYKAGDAAGEAGFGDVVVCPAGIAFDRRVVATLSFHFFEFAVQPVQHSTGSGALITVDDFERLASTFRHLRIASETSEAAKLIRTQHLLRDILFQCDHTCQAPEPTTDDPLMVDIAAKLRENAFGEVILRDVAADAALSPVQLVRRFRAATGQTPRDFVEAIRLAQAKRLLTESDAVLERVAMLCAYQSPFYFSRIFKKRFGMSPSEYRRVNRV